LEAQRGGFYVKFLGGFFLEFEGKSIKVTKNLKQKSMQILQILIKAGSEGISRNRLIEMLEWKGDHHEKKLNNLRCQTCKLRRFICEAGFPEGSYILNLKGQYYFNLDYKTETDIGKMDKLYKKLRSQPDSENREAWLLEIINLYQGEFLPFLTAEEWAVVENAHYHSIYTWSVTSLCQILRERSDYAKMLQVSTKASQIHPYDQWQAVQIECLIAQNKYRDAAEISEKANEVFAKELGIVPFQKKMERFLEPKRKAKQDREIMVQVMESLSEKAMPCGAYQCSYSSFIDICRFLVRVSERTGEKLLLLLCTLCGTQVNSEEIKKENGKLEQQMEQFRNILSGLIRNHDIYTQYSKNQFLVLLTMAGKEAAPLVKRLCQGWAEFEEKESITVKLEIQTLDTFFRKEAI
jgi:DNA-binding SARP family transcriptional activator